MKTARLFFCAVIFIACTVVAIIKYLDYRDGVRAAAAVHANALDANRKSLHDAVEAESEYAHAVNDTNPSPSAAVQ
jgi:hypothetical protein